MGRSNKKTKKIWKSFLKNKKTMTRACFSRIRPYTAVYSVRILSAGLKVNDEKRRGTYRFIEETLGTLSWVQTPSAKSLSRISQANMVGFSLL